MTIRVWPSGRVLCEHTIDLPVSRQRAWGQLRDFATYACHDPYHHRVIPDGGFLRRGVRLQLHHRYFSIPLRRVGRLLKWCEGLGYAFSDLDSRCPARAFPHVFEYQLSDHPGIPAQSRLRVRVTGRWTTPVPRWVARTYLWWVFGQLVSSTERELLLFARAASG
jgi:hypothetical protein